MSEGAPVALWSDLQLSWLQAMGHVVYLDRAAPEPELAPPVLVERDMPAPMAAPRAPAAGPAPVRRPPPAAPAETPVVAPSAAPAPGRRRVGGPDRLQIALLRASGGNPADPRVQQAMAQWPLDALRADPAAKRALWPQLRALRRTPAP